MMDNGNLSFTKKIETSVKESIKKLCSGGFGSFHVVVLGDYMLDRYIHGETDRISPEAPVPVVKFLEERNVPGGAGNVVANLIGLGLSVTAIGRVGKDLNADDLLGLPDMIKADLSPMLRSGRTIVKTRILGSGRHQMLRLDREDIVSPCEDEIETVLNELLVRLRAGTNALVISDYAKGFCSAALCCRVINLCREYKVPVFIDPKSKDWLRYSGAFLITPNLKEFRIITGVDLANLDEEIVLYGTEILRKFSIDNLLVTRSEKGSTLISSSGFKHERTRAVEVYDVSGAGDTMISTVAAFFVAGLPLVECISIANLASQIVIGKIGTYPIKADDLLLAVRKMEDVHCEKTPYIDGCCSEKIITDFNKAKNICDQWKKDNERVIFTNGCFDILHAGHIDSLSGAKGLGDRLVVGLNSDDSVKKLKGQGRPVNSQFDRAKILAALTAVDLIVVFNEETPEELLSVLRPNVLVKGGDYKEEEIAGRQYADELVILSLTKGYSTTRIIQKAGNTK